MENSNKQNLDLIAQMVKTAQRRFYDDSPYYILWGCAVFLASILQYFLLVGQNMNTGIGWAIFIPLALIIQLILIRRQKKKENVKTHIESLLISMWMAFGISLFIILFFANKIGIYTFPIILCFYAITTFVSGGAFKIKAFQFGALVCWILAIIGFFIDYQNQLLLLAAGVLFAFIIPGIILRANEKAETI
jgi:hypothetical protein